MPFFFLQTGLSHQHFRHLKSARFTTLLAMVFIVAFMLITGTASAQTPSSHKILILHSYHQGFMWTDSQMGGIQSVFDKSGLDIELFVEYMDSKRNNPEKIFPLLEETYKFKYHDVHFSVIILTDDNALNFLLPRRETLFPGVPIVFCGINNFEDSRIAGQKEITGVAEDFDLKSTIKLALSLHPSTRHIAVINDNTPTGLANLERLRPIISEFNNAVKFIKLFNLTASELNNRLKDLPDDTVILLLSFYRDRDGRVFSYEEYSAMVRSFCELPIYSAWDFFIGHGTLGGIVTSGRQEGQKAAEMAVKILQGVSARSIPIIRKSPNIPMFDYRQMKRFGISHEDLPESSVVINEPVSIFWRYRHLIWTVIGIITILVLLVAILCINIYRRQQAEKSMRKSEERFKDISHSIADWIWEMDEKGRFTYVSGKVKNVIGYEPKELIGKTAFDLMPEDEARRVKKVLKPIVSERKPIVDLVNWNLTKEGKKICILTNGLAIINEKGEYSGYRGVDKDITRRKGMEKEKKKLQIQFQQAQKMEAIGTLAGGIAHDINNLLMAIQGNASLILLGIDPGHPHYEKIKNIEEYIKKGSILTKQILGFARSGKYEVEPIDPNELVTKASDMFGGTKKEIKIHEKYRKDIWTVEVDRAQIEQVLLNIYVNAWQAMPGGGELYIETENITLDEEYTRPYEAEPGGFVKISITDTGVGMDEAVQMRIFEPFFTTKNIGKGTGLGLASAYGIIKNHNGIMNVYSEKGHGATFNIYLPASENKAAKESRPSEVIIKGKETILLVDDEERIIDVGKEILEALGYKVLLAGSGREAVKIISKAYRAKGLEEGIKLDAPGVILPAPDLVILDMIMPDMGGGQTYDRLKEINPDIKVILSSGYSINGQATEILERGCDGFIQKPFNIMNLSQKIREIFDKK